MREANVNGIDERCDVTLARILAQIHPLDLPRLCGEFLFVLS